MAQLEAIIFDLDGVLTDTAKFHYIAWRKIANDFGFDIGHEDNERLKGVSRVRSLEIILEVGGIEVSAEEKERLALQKNDHYQTFIKKMTPDDILPGMADLLTECKAAGLKLAVGSASKNAPVILPQLGLGDFFDHVVDGNMVTKAKPDPEVFIRAAELLGVSPENTVVFEDAIAGVKAARSGGFFCVGIGDPAHLNQAHLVIPNTINFTLNKLKTAFKEQ